MLSKFTFTLLFSSLFLLGCPPEKTAKRQEDVIKKCNSQALETEISVKEKVKKCRTSKKGGEVKLHFWLDENGGPRKLRNTLASTDEFGQRKCAFDSLHGFSSASQKSCEAEVVFLFASSASKYSNKLSFLRDALTEDVSEENIEMFRNVFAEHGPKMEMEDMDVVTAYGRALYEREGLETHKSINPPGNHGKIFGTGQGERKQ